MVSTVTAALQRAEHSREWEDAVSSAVSELVMTRDRVCLRFLAVLWLSFSCAGRCANAMSSAGGGG